MSKEHQSSHEVAALNVTSNETARNNFRNYQDSEIDNHQPVGPPAESAEVLTALGFVLERHLLFMNKPAAGERALDILKRERQRLPVQRSCIRLKLIVQMRAE